MLSDLVRMFRPVFFLMTGFFVLFVNVPRFRIVYDVRFQLRYLCHASFQLFDTEGECIKSFPGSFCPRFQFTVVGDAVFHKKIQGLCRLLQIEHFCPAFVAFPFAGLHLCLDIHKEIDVSACCPAFRFYRCGSCACSGEPFLQGLFCISVPQTLGAGEPLLSGS